MKHETTPTNASEKGIARLEMFSDGVFAIAITLLGLEMKVPSPEKSDSIGLGPALLEQWPVYVSFLTSFFIILVIWNAHHQLFKLVQGMNRPLFFANALLLCAVTVIPFTTNLVAEYFNTAHRNTAMMTYSFLSFPVGFGFVGLLKTIMGYPEVRKPHVEVKRVKAWYRRMWITSIFFVASFAFSFFESHVSLGIILSAAIYWSFAKTY
ncbi:MAG TPA: TMEM175 family protein [Chitinophagaceae bacterium]|nr:TMEM175 family protein [Chitinophagaceae bacterium]